MPRIHVRTYTHTISHRVSGASFAPGFLHNTHSPAEPVEPVSSLTRVAMPSLCQSQRAPKTPGRLLVALYAQICRFFFLSFFVHMYDAESGYGECVSQDGVIGSLVSLWIARRNTTYPSQSYPQPETGFAENGICGCNCKFACPGPSHRVMRLGNLLGLKREGGEEVVGWERSPSGHRRFTGSG